MSMAPGATKPPAPTYTTFTVKPGEAITRWSWAVFLLHELGIHPNNENVRAIVAWEQAEGGATNNDAKWNPLNTTQDAEGSHSINSVGVKSYPDFVTGLQASADTLRNGRYDNILTALQTGSAGDITSAIGASPWGTGGGASLVLAGGQLDKDAVLGDPQLKQSFTDSILTGPIGDAAAGAIHGAGHILKPLSFLESLAKGSTWVHVAYVVGGFVLAVIGILVLLRKDIGKVASMIPTPASQAVAAVTE